MTARKRNPFLLALALLVSIAPTGNGALAQDEAEQTASAPTVEQMGMMLEQARRLPSDQVHPRLLELTEPMLRVLNSDLDDQRRAAASWLAAELMDELGRHASSQERWSEAEDVHGKGPFADDLEFAQIRALEMNGQDVEAAKRWEKWEKRHGGSPLFPEVRLARAWNALRRGANEEAAKRLGSIPEEFQWMRSDPRYRVAQATLAHVQGDDALTLQILETNPVAGASATYLRALAHDRQGETLKAAALYQEVIERYGDSPLRDFAMLAKANTFLEAEAHRSAAEEFDRAAQLAGGDDVRAESALRHAASILMDDDVDAATTKLRAVVDEFAGSSVAARAQFLLGETLFERGLYEDAIVEYNRVLRDYFEHQVAASAQYRVGRCHDALGRRPEAVGAYEAVVQGYPLEPESPVAAYLAGVDLLEMDRPHDAVPYFQLVLDRYGASRPAPEQQSEPGQSGIMVFASEEQREVVEAALCLLQYSWYRVGDLGQLSGAPHLLLQRMPPSRSTWRVYAILIDADALAAQGRYTEAQNSLNMLLEQFPEHPAGRPAMQLLAWTYAQEGRDDLALGMDQQLLRRYGEDAGAEAVANAQLRMAHVHFNAKRYREAAELYERFRSATDDPQQKAQATYQVGLCYMRLDRTGDAVDRWEEVVAANPSAAIAERAWVRAGDLYFSSAHYEDAKRCYQGLLENFAGSDAAAQGMLRLAQCEYNAGNDAEALESFAAVKDRYPLTPIATEAERGMELAFYRLGQKEGGREVLEHLVELYPASSFAPDAQFEIARQLFEEERFVEAAESFRRVVSRYPGYEAADRAQFLLGDALFQGGNPEEAAQSWNQFLVFFPESDLRPTVQFRLAMHHFEEEDYLPAAVKFMAVLEQQIDDSLHEPALFNIALCRRLMGEKELALQDLQRYRAEYDSSERAAEIAYYMGDIHQQAGRCLEAIGEYQHALENGPSNQLICELNVRVGQSHECLGEGDLALKAYERARDVKAPTDPYRLTAVARCAAIYEEREDYQSALEAYRDLERNADDPELKEAASSRASELDSYLESIGKASR